MILDEVQISNPPPAIPLRDSILPLAALIFILQVILLWPMFTPNLQDIGQFDEANYVEAGRLFTLNDVPALNRYPAVAAFYAMTYLPFRHSAFWLIYSCGLGRFFLFALLWLSAYLAARQISHVSHPLVMIGLLSFSPIPAGLARNGSHALFTAMSVFALAQFIAFYRQRKLLNLAFASAFMGLALLSRMGEATLLSVSFIALAALLGIAQRRIRKTLTAALIPGAVIVGTYLIVCLLVSGKSPFGNSDYFYLAFEAGHSMANREQFSGQNYWVEGVVEARKYFGTREENHTSVIAAIRRNPPAYLQRIPRLAMEALLIGIDTYGGPLSLWLFLLAVQGCIELVKKKQYWILAALLLWPSYCIIFILLIFQESQLLMLFPIVFCLASIGLSGLLSFSRKQQLAWSAVLLLFFVAAAIRNTTLAYMFSPLMLLAGLWLVWITVSKYGQRLPVQAPALVFLFFAMVLFRDNASSQKPRTLGSAADERAVVFLKNSFKENAAIASYSPNVPIAARKVYVELTGVDTRATIHSGQDLELWLKQNNVDAIYVDDYLRRFEPPLWSIIEEQIGTSLEVVFSSDDPYIQITRIR